MCTSLNRSYEHWKHENYCESPIENSHKQQIVSEIIVQILSVIIVITAFGGKKLINKKFLNECIFQFLSYYRLLLLYAKAIGSSSEGAQQNLQDNYTTNMTIQDAVNLALRTLKQVMEEKLNSTNVEVMIMTPANLFQMYTKAEVEKIIEDLQ